MDNPYEPPHTTAEPAHRKRPLIEHVLALAALLILALPAGAIAFFAVCWGAVLATSSIDEGMQLGVYLGSAAWIVVSGGIILFVVRTIAPPALNPAAKHHVQQ